jgi:uncharacterized SAM-binding protein YcdF (DUF218 family)
MKNLRRITIGLVILALATGCFTRLGNWLAVAGDPGRPELIVCLGGSSERLDKAAELWHQGLADRVLATSRGVYRELLARRVDPAGLIAPPWSATSTYEEGLLLRALLPKGCRSLVVISDPYHLFRVRWTMRHLFAGVDCHFSYLGSDFSPPPNLWWKEPHSRLFVFSEIPKILYYWSWHGVLGIVEDPDWAHHLYRLYMAAVRRLFT